MSTVTIQQANVLTKKGFIRRFREAYVPGKVTQVDAYEQIERLHEQVDEDGKRMYSDFRSFERQLYKKSPVN